MWQIWHGRKLVSRHCQRLQQTLYRLNVYHRPISNVSNDRKPKPETYSEKTIWPIRHTSSSLVRCTARTNRFYRRLQYGECNDMSSVEWQISMKCNAMHYRVSKRVERVQQRPMDWANRERRRQLSCDKVRYSVH